jgi:hypothetical protein
LPSIRELGHTHEHQHVTDPSRATDAASSWTHSASTHRSSICAGPGTTPPRHRPDSTVPRVCTTAPTIPSRFQHNPPPKGRQTTKQAVPPAYGEAVIPTLRSVWPPRPSCEKANPPDGPSGLRPPRTEPPLRGATRLFTNPARHKRRQGRPTRPTRHYALHELEKVTDDYPGDHNL